MVPPEDGCKECSLKLHSQSARHPKTGRRRRNNLVLRLKKKHGVRLISLSNRNTLYSYTMETIYARVQLLGSGRSHIHGYKRTPPTFVDGSLTFASSTDSSITVGGVRAYSRESSFDILAAAFPAGDGTAATFADVQAASSTASVLSVSGIANLSEANAASAHEFVLSGLLPDTQYDIVFFARDVLGLVTEVGVAVLEGAGIKTAADHTPPVSVAVAVNTVEKLAISEVTGSTITIQTKGYDVGSTFQAHVAAFQVGTGAETMTLGGVKGHETYKASGLMNITSLSAAQASSPISVVVDMGLKELTAYEVVVFLEDAIGNVSSRLVSPHATTLDETPPAVVAFAVDAAATTETSISACIKAYDAGSAFSVYAKAFAAGVSVADSDTVEKLGGAGAALVAAGVTNASETDATTNPIDIDLTDLTASTAYDIVVLMVDTATPVPNILRYQYTQSVTTAAPPISRSVEFDGTNQYMTNSNHFEMNSDNGFTISTWVNRKNSDDKQMMVFQGGSVGPGSVDEFSFYLQSSGTLRYWMGSSFNDTTTIFNKDSWYNIIAVFKNTTVSIYINGVLDNSITGSTLTLLSTVLLSFGSRINEGAIREEYFEGTMDDIAMFSTDLDASSIAAIYNYGTPLDLRTNSGDYTQSSALQAYWKLDGDFLDSSVNGYHLIEAGSPTFSLDVPAPVSRSVKGPDSENIIKTVNPIPGFTQQSEITIALWVKHSDMTNGWIFRGGFGFVGVRGLECFFFSKDNENITTFAVYTDGAYTLGSDIYLDYGQGMNPDTWYHIAMTKTNNNDTNQTAWRLYINGENVKHVPNGQTVAGDDDDYSFGHNNTFSGTATYFQLFSGFAGGHYFGSMDNVTLYNVGLDSDKMRELYNGGQLVDPTKLTTSDSLVGWWSMNDDFLDRSGNGHHLTAVTGSPTFSADVPAPISKSLNLNSSSQLLLSTHGEILNDSFTISVWFNEISTTSDRELLRSNDRNLVIQGNNYIFFGNSQSAGKYFRTQDNIFNQNEWNHVCVTYKANEPSWICYLNGNLLDLNENFGGGAVVNQYSSLDFQIGSALYSGYLSNYSIFSDAFELTQVSELYNGGIPGNLLAHSDAANLQAWWKLNGDYLDRSGNGYHLTAVGSPTFSFNIPGGDNIVRAWNFSSNSLEPYIGSTEMSFVSSTGDYNDQGGFVTDEKGSYFNFNSTGYLRATSIGLEPYTRENEKEFTFSMWYLLTSHHSGRANHFRIQNSDEIEGLFSYGATDNRVRYFSNREQYGPAGNLGPTPNVWSHFMVVVKSNSDHKMYVNGVQVTSWSGAPPPPNGFLMDGKILDKIDVGKFSESGDHAVRDIRVYNRALSATEVTAIYDNGDGYI